MKILCVGDLHFRHELPYSSSIKDGRRKEWEAVKKTIINAAKECEEIVLLGDCFNSRHNHSAVISEFINFLNGFGEKEVHIIVGNHERYSNLTALDFIKELDKDNWHIYSKPTRTFIGGKTATMIPFMNPTVMNVADIKEATKKLVSMLTASDLLFTHHAISGTTGIEFFNEIVLDKDLLSSLFKMTFAGHVHKKEKIDKNILITGSVFPDEVGEYEKSIFIIDTDNMLNPKEIRLPVRGIYKMIWEKKLNVKIPDNAIVKCYVTDKKTNLAEVKKELKRFDSFLLIESYGNERKKVYFEKGSLDLSMNSLLQLYAKAKKLKYADLKEGFEIIKQGKLK